MTLALDFDGTFTEDPDMWRSFIRSAQLRGHTVICATGRKEWTDDMARYGLPEIPIVYCWGMMKEEACRKAGYSINVWIDDCPGMIQNCLLIGEDKDL